MPGQVFLGSLSRAAFTSAAVEGRSRSGLGWPWYSSVLVRLEGMPPVNLHFISTSSLSCVLAHVYMIFQRSCFCFIFVHVVTRRPFSCCRRPAVGHMLCPGVCGAVSLDGRLGRIPRWSAPLVDRRSENAKCRGNPFVPFSAVALRGVCDKFVKVCSVLGCCSRGAMAFSSAVIPPSGS